jgi:CPA1 family monovalent cation:H+ antiporter
MDFLDITAILLTLAALFAYINHRWIKLPVTIGIMLISLIMSLVMIAVGQFIPAFDDSAKAFVESIDFNKALMNCMLSYLLFAGALHVNLTELKQQKRIVAIMATLGLALALAIPKEAGDARTHILVATYIIVIFSISVQGLTLKSLISRSLAKK